MFSFFQLYILGTAFELVGFQPHLKTTLKKLIALEEMAKFLFAFWLSIWLGNNWYLFLLCLFIPDLSIIGYVVGSRAGSWIYNVFHHQALAILAGVAGILLNKPELQFASCVLFGHSALDRAFGFGLKFQDSFTQTHLGKLGKG